MSERCPIALPQNHEANAKKSVCRCGYVFLPDSMCMNCYVSLRTLFGEEPCGILNSGSTDESK